ncbi:LuxR C-terminal-related transcriptional regulator [Billgrantia kenyensis]|uniref:DNA-binding response regulator n=1 Tax=Billgrantia kenyensis TaxID=321266 RepID=A0A7W0AC51_9GAMM|nr:LuxR C-terminal-related transcriptional regulator [Halomonas kenyensis]MBA2777861.1 DNA-binding response regulator [Halomonas kenyensis]MCG6661332.1 DNA-binding response regulator [Halomonas kenyensis]
MESRETRVLLVTDINPQSKLFIEHLQQQLGHEVVSVDTGMMPSLTNEEAILVILDLDHLSEAEMQKWQEAVDGKDNISLAAFNVRGEDHAVELLSALNLQGIFYRNDSVELICKGIDALQSGSLWMSRTLMSRMIQLLRRQQMNSYRPACGLTQRELEIIGLLGTGATNSEIAEKLFVSEHTVKSHLYNIFRKIKVHNRLQAMNWARRNLFSVPPSYKRDARH